MKTTTVDILVSLLVFLVHTTLLKFLILAEIAPDVSLVWIVYLALRRGQTAGTIAGFLIGLLFDLVGGESGMLGLAALAKTTAGFTAGFFYNENKMFQTLGGYQFILIVALASAVHNLIYFLIFLQGSGLSWAAMIFRYGIPTTLYTTATALIPMFIVARRTVSHL